DQRGLAHFLEHMCFNGTEHFPGNSLISYLESIGVKFGAHLNAYTSTDETVYNISKAPTARWSAVDSCLLILRDWSCALTLNDADIDSERGIIVNEWRQRRTASNRMLEKAMPRLYDGDIYGNRMPIGLMSVVENFKPQTLRDFYDRWYIPANQAIIVTGDFDIKKMEKSLRRIFSDIPASRSPISEKIGLHTVPMAPALTTVVESDAEQGVEMMQIYFRIAPEDAAATPAHDAIAEMAGTMLANRFDALEASSDCPHTSLGIGEVRFLMSRGEKAITLRGTLKPGKAEEALEAWYAEVLRAIRHGFSDQEIIEARQALMATLDERQRADAHSSNTRLAKKIVRHFLDGGRKVNGSEYRDQIRKAAGRVTSDDVVAYLGKAVRPSGKGAVILHYRPDSGQNDDAALQKRLADVFAATSARPLAPYVPLSSAGSILAAEPDPGHITGRDSLPVFGAMVYKLSNGISVIAKKTEFKPDQIYVRGYSPGGLSQVYDPADVPTLRAVNDLMNSMNYSGRTQADLRRILGTTNIKVSQSVGNMEEGIEAATNRADMTDAFRMIFLRATGFEADSTAFRSWMDSQRNAIAGKRLNPTQAMGDTIHTTIYSRHP
ncbi:MAG: insulinase family protein, partial [Muribaculaceae bacterium]|nr:insulinase family protein [Muribaculaceae bacterium]